MEEKEKGRKVCSLMAREGRGVSKGCSQGGTRREGVRREGSLSRGWRDQNSKFGVSSRFGKAGVESAR